MVRTYEIDFDDALVDSASTIFEELGTDIDTAITMFLKQAVLRKGFPFEVVIPSEDENSSETEPLSAPELEDAHAGVSEEEESAVATATESVVPPISSEIAARVAANEALVAEMRAEIGDKAVTPEFDKTEDDGTHGDYETTPTTEPEGESATEASGDAPAASEVEADEEDEDETAPEHIFDAWDVGDEEDIGCR